MRDKMILGKNAEFSRDTNITGINNNVIVCGGTGSGKTMSVVEPCLLNTFDSSLIITVTKRRLLKKYTPIFESRGYKVDMLDFTNPECSTASFDPLSYVKTYTDISLLTKSIVHTENKYSNFDPYWDETASLLLSAEIGAVMLIGGKERSFSDVLKMNETLYISGDDNITTNMEAIFSKIDRQRNSFRVSESRRELANHTYNCWKAFSKLPFKTASCVLGTLNTRLNEIFSPQVKKMIDSSNVVKFNELADERHVLFVVSSPVNTSLQKLIALFYTTAFKELFNYAEAQGNGRLPIPVHVICDDFATGGKIENFDEYISIFREKQIAVTLLLQSESQLDSMYGDNEATTIINNCDSYVYMGGMDLKTARSISERTNQPLDEVLNMPVGEEFILRRGRRPIETQRYDITKIKGMEER